VKSKRVSKRLTRNDLGETGSHQSAIHVPKRAEIIAFFPELDESEENPSCMIDIWSAEVAREYQLRFIHYNNRVVGSGTRDEYRLTGTRLLLRELNARSGDDLVLESGDGPSMLVSIVRGGETIGRQAGVRELIGGWRIEIGEMLSDEH
jgi:hypothetical protein